MKWCFWSSISLQILFIPVALLAVIIPANEYAAQGFVAVDCDGPLVVIALAIPSYLIYGAGALVYIIAYHKTGKIHYLLVAVFCCLIVAVITPNVIDAINEHNKNQIFNEQTCGKGW